MHDGDVTVQKRKLRLMKGERPRRSALAAIVAAIVVFIDQATDVALGLGALLLTAAWCSRGPRHRNQPTATDHLARETTSL